MNKNILDITPDEFIGIAFIGLIVFIIVSTILYVIIKLIEWLVNTTGFQ